MKTFKHVLVPTDFSDPSFEALHTARAMCPADQTRFTIAHVIPDVWTQPWVLEAGVNLAQFDSELRENANRQLTALLAAEGLLDQDVTTAVLVGTPPHAAIVRYAADHGVDLIVMGAHGRGPVQRFFLGSVAERVIRTASCAVLTIRHDAAPPADATPSQVPVGAAVDNTTAKAEDPGLQ